MDTNTTTIRSEDNLKRFTSPARWARMEERAEARRPGRGVHKEDGHGEDA